MSDGPRKIETKVGIFDPSRLSSLAPLFAALLEELAFGEVVEVLLDPKFEGVRVPEHIRAADGVWFNYSLAFVINPITDLVASDEGIAATLSFGGAGLHHTFVPWKAVRFMQIPPGVSERAIEKLAKAQQREDARARFHVVRDDEAPPAGEALPVIGGELRLVKGGEA